MNYENQIIDLANGELPDKKSGLFQALAADEELQNLLGQHLAINHAAENAKKQFQAGTDLRQALLAEVDKQPGKKKKRIIPIWLSYAAVATVFFLGGLIIPTNKENEIIKSEIPKLPEPVSISVKYPVTGEPIRKNNLKTYHSKIQPKNKNRKPIAAISESNIIKNSNNLQLVEKPQMVRERIPWKMELPIDLSNDLGLTASLGFSMSRNLPQAPIAPAAYSMLNNLSVGLSKDISGGLTLSAELRQETFYLDFTGMYGGLFSRIELQPNLTTFSLNLRREFTNLEIFRPYGMLSAGVNRGGAVFRAGAGFLVRIYPDYYFGICGEYSKMYFDYSGEYFSADKAGLVFRTYYSF